MPDENVMDFEQILFSQSRRIELDKAGRIRLPEILLQVADISGQTVILGVRDHLELRNPISWNQMREDKLSKLKEIMLRARIQGSAAKKEWLWFLKLSMDA